MGKKVGGYMVRHYPQSEYYTNGVTSLMHEFKVHKGVGIPHLSSFFVSCPLICCLSVSKSASCFSSSASICRDFLLSSSRPSAMESIRPFSSERIYEDRGGKNTSVVKIFWWLLQLIWSHLYFETQI